MRQGGGKRSLSRTYDRLPSVDFERIVQEAKARHNLSDIVGRHTTLKKRGARELVGLCCFHTERTPSLEVNDAKGTYHCHGCGEGGDAISFLVKQEGMRFTEAVQWLLGDELPVISEAERAQRKAADERETAERITLARSIWARTVPLQGTPAEVYLRSRAITFTPPESVRFVMTPRWRNAETGEVGRDHPALACALQNAAGAVVGVQCVFLQDGGRRKYERERPDGTKGKAKLTFGVIVGSALRLGPVAEHLIVCEGPEDGLTLAQDQRERSVWVACGTALMSRIEYPPEVRSVCFAGDNGTAGRAAVAEAREAALAAGLKPSEAYPDPLFKDWNEQLQAMPA